MSNYLKSSKKPCYLFVFSDEQQAKHFYAFASSQEHSAFVQHPFAPDGRSRDFKRVLVTGVGSLFFDTALKSLLEKKAEELDGYYLPKV